MLVIYCRKTDPDIMKHNRLHAPCISLFNHLSNIWHHIFISHIDSMLHL